MQILHGIDRLSSVRIQKLYARHGSRGLRRLFTDTEIHALTPTCVEDLPPELPAHLIDSFTARYCAKEAVAKALRTGFRDGVTLHGIEILRDAQGAPVVVLHDGAQARADALGVTDITLSLTHEGGVVFASVIMLVP